jgi:phytanoyl-CoA hydroxylase
MPSGHDLGREFEEKFTAKAKASGLREEEAKSAFNKNMLSSGLLAEGPAEFGLMHNRHWLVSAYDAGDVVLHSPYMVSVLLQPFRILLNNCGADTCFDCQSGSE